MQYDPTQEQWQQFREQLNQSIEQSIQMASGEQINQLNKLKDQLKQAGTDPGQLQAIWNKMRDLSGFRRFSRRGGIQGMPAEPGEFQVMMIVDGKTYTSNIIVRHDPLLEG